jgi:hypothetical protein
MLIAVAVTAHVALGAARVRIVAHKGVNLLRAGRELGDRGVATLLEEGHAPEGWREQVHAAAARRSTPVLGITLLLLIAERALGVGIFDPSLGGASSSSSVLVGQFNVTLKFWFDWIRIGVMLYTSPRFWA